jgi:hypothetical protein
MLNSIGDISGNYKSIVTQFSDPLLCIIFTVHIPNVLISPDIVTKFALSPCLQRLTYTNIS